MIALAPAVAGDFTNWDDPLYLVNNTLTEAPLQDGASGLLLTESIGYAIPVTVLSYAAQRATFDLEPSGFHAVSVALHIMMIALVAWVARRFGASEFAAAAAASIFAVHPLVVEPVAWVVGQKDLLAGCFVLSAIALRARPRGDSRWQTAAVGVLVLLSMLSKPSAVAAPLIVMGVDYVRGRRLSALRNVGLYGTTAAMAVAVTLLALVGHGGAPVDALGTNSLAEAGWALGLQTRHVFWPSPLLARYFPSGSLVPGIALGLTAFATLTAVIVWCARTGRREVAFGLAAAVSAYAPVSGLLPMTRGTADSYMYLPLALAAIAIAHGIDWARKRAQNVCHAIVALILVASVLTTMSQTATWANATALWAPVAEHHPDEPRALMRLGDARLFDGEPADALAIYEHLRRRFPNFPTSTIAHANTLERLGRTAEAERVFALGAQLGDGPRYREEYGFFLIRNGAVPSDPEQARASLLQITPLLADRGKRPASLARASELLDALGEPEAAARLRARRNQLR